MKHLTVKIDPGAKVNTIPLSRYRKIFPKKMTKNGYPKPLSLNTTSHSWISHDGKLQPFLGPIHCQHQACLPDQIMPDMHFYVFEDATSPHILLLYATSEQLGILQFSVPNLVTQVHIDASSLPTPSGFRKTAK